MDIERLADTARVREALRQFVFAPGEEPVVEPGDPPAPEIWTNRYQYSVFGTTWLIRTDPTIDDAVVVVSERGSEFVVCYGLLLARDGSSYFLNDTATLREFGRHLGHGLDPVAFAEMLAALHSYPSGDDPVVYPPALGDLSPDSPPVVSHEGATLVLDFSSTVRHVTSDEGVIVDTLAWRVDAQPGEPARWVRRLVDRTPVD